jgi:hypothetical protein
MATTVINAYSMAFPLITNSIRVNIAKQSDGAVVATQTKPAPHPTRTWSFPGLPRTNYKFTMDEVDSGGGFIQQLAYFDIVPGDLDTGLLRVSEQIKVGVTPGLTAGLNTFTFDGTSGKPDWRNWEISPEEYGGVGTLIKNDDYSWDSSTGVFTYLKAGMVFSSLQWFTVEFEAQPASGANSVSQFIDFSMRIVTTTSTLLASDFGAKIIVEPAGNNIIVTLPPLTSVASGRPLMFETKIANEFRCVEIRAAGADVIKFQFGKLFMMMNESLFIYRFTAASRNEWRVYNMQGNFDSAGRIVSNDLSNVYNKIPMDGAALDIFQYGRLYNEVVLRLPVGQAVAFDNWSANQTFYSLANSADPSNVNKFHVPNRLGLFEKINKSPRVTGSYELDAVGTHTHLLFTDQDVGDVGIITPSTPVTRAAGLGGNSSYRVQQGTGTPTVGKSGPAGGTETTVKNYSINKYILV